MTDTRTRPDTGAAGPDAEIQRPEPLVQKEPGRPRARRTGFLILAVIVVVGLAIWAVMPVAAMAGS